MKKTLIIVSHPNIHQSVINKRWINELKLYPDLFTIHELYSTYPDGKIDIEKEHLLVETHEHLVLQFPLYWFNCPPLLKKWFDDVLTYGWAYGSEGNKLKNKKIALAVSLGGKENEYQGDLTLADLLHPFEMSIQYVKANYQGYFALYGAHIDPNKASITKQQIEDNAKNYIKYLSAF